MAQSQVSSRIEGVVTKDGVRNFGSNGHGFTVVPYSGTDKPKAEGEKGDARPAVFADTTYFGELPAGVVPGARIAVSGYVFKGTFRRKDGSEGESFNVKAFQVEVLDPNAQTNAVLVGRIGRDGAKPLGSGKVFTIMPYSGKNKEGNFMPSVFVDVKLFGVDAVIAPGANVKVVGTLSRREYTRKDGSTGQGYELFAKSVDVLEAARSSGSPAPDAGSTLGYEEQEPVF